MAATIKLPDPTSGNLVYDDGSHILIGSSKADILVLAKATNATVNGGGGIDTLFLNSVRPVKVNLGLMTAQKTGFGTLTIKAVENIVTGSGHDTLFGSKSANFLFSGKGNDVMRAGAGNDVVLGDVGNDKLYGEDDNDILSGGVGVDTLYGGKGKDSFVFAEKVSKKNMDKIMDFNVKDDTIHLAREFFTKIGKVGLLKAGAFHVGTKAAAADDRIIYNKATGALYYDADGSGSGAAVQFASVGKNLPMTHKDFYVI